MALLNHMILVLKLSKLPLKIRCSEKYNFSQFEFMNTLVSRQYINKLYSMTSNNFTKAGFVFELIPMKQTKKKKIVMNILRIILKMYMAVFFYVFI